MNFDDTILQLARIRPLQPTNVAKALGKDSFMASAMLADLASKGKLKISNIKVGSSPLYYVPGQEASLQEFIKSLNEKDQKTVILLSEKKILRDKELDPLTRVSLRQTKDFSIPLEVGLNEQRELFWKWYLLSNEDAEKLIKEMLNIKEPEIKKEQSIQIEQPILQQEKQEDQRTEKRVRRKRVEKQEKIETIEQELNKETNVDFDNNVKKFFQENKIIIQEQLIQKKNSELLLEIPSPVGTLNYYCVVKDKKKITDGDLSNAFVQGQLRKLSILFITRGELTKKAEEMLKQLKGLTFKKI